MVSKTRMITREAKINALKAELYKILNEGPIEQINYDKNVAKDEDWKPRLNRQQIREMISKVLKISGRNTISGWITVLLAHDIIQPNPHSVLSAKRHKIMPTNDSLYYINDDKLRQGTHINSQSKLFK